MPEAASAKSTRWLTVILINPAEFGADRESVRLALEAENIESRPIWKPMYLQPVFRAEKSGVKNEVGRKRQESSSPLNTQGARHEARVVGGAVSEYLFERGLCLPYGTRMTDWATSDMPAGVARLPGGEFAHCCFSSVLSENSSVGLEGLPIS